MIIKNPKRIECRVLAIVISGIIYYNFETLLLCIILGIVGIFLPLLFLPLTRIMKRIFGFLAGKFANAFIFISFWGVIYPYSLVLYPLKIFRVKKNFMDKDDWIENNFTDELKWKKN